jgi:hypothetical protein
MPTEHTLLRHMFLSYSAVTDRPERHLKPKRYKKLMVAEEREKKLIRKVADQFVVFAPRLADTLGPACRNMLDDS